MDTSRVQGCKQGPTRRRAWRRVQGWPPRLVQYQESRRDLLLVRLWCAVLNPNLPCHVLTNSLAFWIGSVTLLVLDWRSGRLSPHREPPFTRPTHQPSETEHEDDDYHHVSPIRQTAPGRYDEESARPVSSTNPFNDSYSAPSAIPPSSGAYTGVPAGRPSMDAYGAFSDPAPTGFGNTYGSGSGGYGQTGGSAYPASPPRQAQQVSGPPTIPEIDLGPRVSRTMQYADPYAAVRANIGGGTSPTGPAGPPSYESYGGYR